MKMLSDQLDIGAKIHNRSYWMMDCLIQTTMTMFR